MGVMEKPEKLFENGPEWEECESESGPAFEVTVHEMEHQLLPCSNGKCWGDENQYDSASEALDAIRARILEHRDALNRITPPSAEWVPVGEVKDLREGRYLASYTEVWAPEENIRPVHFDGHARWNGVKHDRPLCLLCISGHPIEAPPVPGGG